MKSQMRLWNVLVASVLLLSALFGGKPVSQAQAAQMHPATLTSAYQSLPFSQDWTYTGLITLNDDWSGVPGIQGFLGDVGTSVTGVDPQTILTPGTTIDAIANLLYTTSTAGGVGEFEITDPVVGLQGSGTADYPHIVIYLNTTGLTQLRVRYNVRDIDDTIDNSVQQVALQYRVGETADFTNLPAGYIADATTGPSLATQVTPVDVTLPTAADNQAQLQVRVITTNAIGSDEWVGIDDITVVGVPLASSTNPSGTGLAAPNKIVAGDTESTLSVSVIPGTNPDSTNLAVSCDLSTIGGSATQAFLDDGLNGDLTAGDQIFSYKVAADSSMTAGAKNLACTISDDQARNGSATIGLSVYLVISMGAVNGPIGSLTDAPNHNAALKSQIVTVRGVIYEKTLQPIKASTNMYYGFFIQNLASQADSDVTTSDGLFAYMNTTATLSGPGGTLYTPTVGDEVTISGSVSEYYFMTELTNPILLETVHQSGVDINASLPAVVANPPDNLADANRYWERLQGMRVQVPQNSLVVSGRNVFSPIDGEIWIVSPNSTVAQRSGAYMNRAFRDAHPLDDNYNATAWDGNGYRMLMGSWGVKGASGDVNALIEPGRTFDTVTNTPAGGLNYSFYKYRIEVTDQPAYTEGIDPSLNNPPQAVDPDHGYTIADYNLENLYDFRDNPFSGCDFAGNAGCPKVDPFAGAVNPPYDYVPASDADYQARLNDIALQIINDLHSPDILMVQEVENQDICTVSDEALTCGAVNNVDGKPDGLQELALKIAANNGPAYEAAWDSDSSDLRGIAPAYLYRTERVELLPAAGDPLLGDNPAITYAGDPVAYDSDVSNPKTLNAVLPAGVAACETNWVFPRAPSVALFRITATHSGEDTFQDVYVINNHFKSGPDSCVPHRTEQAKYNAALIAFIQAAKPDARVVMGGDLNVYPRPDDPFAPIGQVNSSDQLASLYAPALNLKNMWDVMVNLTPESAYSYVYVGMAQTLDQMFINQAMMKNLNQVKVAHINSDFPSEYSGDEARGTSDHDPLVATFNFVSQEPAVNAGGPYRVNQASTVELTAAGDDPTGGPASYAWDLDDNGSFETLGQTVTFHSGLTPGDYTVSVKITSGTGLTNTDTVNVTVNYRFMLPFASY